ncbi:LysR family transcriptional regulator [Pseudonocardia hierapolitana]|uniref:LysR family transcriptional regulator n=1 Tax=Pseudonocardia hierapolitana TaxID=1128676 RepID=A0A561SX61_9PSEU|nr:LysR family transcriptional regulator [Pseudonocardia hierapolitana]TWF79449.1 LysR family transcriptional regulator [Pseudonocardia hierapolitana]
MELRHLRSFLAVADELHFSRAARRLHMAQSPLSQQIQRLEREIGVPLFRRNRRKVELTDAGLAMLDHARRAIDHAEQAAGAARAAGTGRAGRLGIGFLATAALALLPAVLPTFRRAAPDAELRLTEAGSQDLLRALHRGELDVAFTRPPAPTAELTAAVVWREPVIAVLPAGHPLCAAPDVRLADLHGEDFVTFPRWSAPEFYDHLVAACHAAGFAPRIVQEALAMPTVVGLVAAGLGVALVPAGMRHLALPGVAHRQLRGDPAHAEIAMVHLAGNDRPLLSAFTATVRATLGG